jgi:hypothetical protein
MKNVIALLCFAFGGAQTLSGQVTFVPRNKIRLQIDFEIMADSQRTQFVYSLSNGTGAEQNVWQFRLYLTQQIEILEQGKPSGWIGSYSTDGRQARAFWASPSRGKHIRPGNSASGFFLNANYPPGVVTFYAEGYGPIPEGEEDSIPGYDDLTPYGPGIVGKTVGPVLPPEPFVPMTFLDTLASYKHQAATLGWVGQEGFLRQLDEKLDQARDQLSKGHIKQARDKVEEFLKKLENEAKKTEKDQDKKNDKKWVTSEGHALLKFNAEYLIEKLDEQITKKK